MSDVSDQDFYEHSGRHGFAAPAVMLIVLPVAVALAAAYSYIVVYCPVVGYVNILFLGGLLLGVGALLDLVAKKSKCRSDGLMAFLGLLTGVVTLYFSWVFFIIALFGREGPAIPPMQLAANPNAVWAAVNLINANGWWMPSGIAQWVITIVEAAVIVGGLGLIGWGCLDREVFCEDCNSWCEPHAERHMRIGHETPTSPSADAPVDDSQDAPDHVPDKSPAAATPGDPIDDPELSLEGAETPEADGESYLARLTHVEILKLPPTEPDEYPRFTAEVLKCIGCGETTAIRLKLVNKTIEDGEETESSEDIPGILIRKAESLG